MSHIWLILNRQTYWLKWWQEIILNWVATWPEVSVVIVNSADGSDQVEWDAPSDFELKCIELEQLMQAD